MLTRQTLIAHIMRLKKYDEDYARHALREYMALLPWMDLADGVREAMKGQQ